MIVLCLTGCAGAKRLQTAQSSNTRATATKESREHVAQTSNSESLTIADDGLEMEWLRLVFYPPDSIGRQAIKSEERGHARHTRQEQTSECMAVETAASRCERVDSIESRADITTVDEREAGSGINGTEIVLTGIIFLFIMLLLKR